MQLLNLRYLDTDGIRHSVEVEAGSLYEAAARAATTLKQHQCEPAETCDLEIEISSSATHTKTLKKIRQWFEGSARSPKEAFAKGRLRELLYLGQPRSKRKRPDPQRIPSLPRSQSLDRD
jgi:hypothetical protein